MITQGKVLQAIALQGPFTLHHFARHPLARAGNIGNENMLTYIDQQPSVNRDRVDWRDDLYKVKAAVQADPDRAVDVCDSIVGELHPDHAIVLVRTILKSAKRNYGKNTRRAYSNKRKLRRKQNAISSALAVLQICRWKYR